MILVAAGTVAVLLLLRAPPTPSGTPVLEPVHEDLAFPVALAFAPDGRLFYNELRGGQVRLLQEGQLLDDPFLTLEVAQEAETGLLGLALDPEFPLEPYVYVYYTYEDGDGLHNRISRFPDEGNLAGPEEVLLDDLPANTRHNGGRLAFGPDGHLYASLGDTLDRPLAQDPASPAGKILRMGRDGSLPTDNPFDGSYAYLLGIRNVFGMDFTPGGTLLFTENGPGADDEVNRGRAGENYGWPEVQGRAGDERFVDPLLEFTPTIAPTGLAFYTGDALGPNYTGAAYFGSYNDGVLRRVVGDVDAGEAFEAEVLLRVSGDAVLDVAQGPDDHLYLSTTGGIYRVVLEPEEEPPAMAGIASPEARAEGFLGKRGLPWPGGSALEKGPVA